jgi:Flp pilus assembly protein TadG
MKTLRAKLNRLQKDDSGLSVIELAVVLPVLLTIGLGVMEFGNLIYRQHLIINGVRDAARYASGRFYDVDDADLTAAVTSAAQNIATTGAVANGTSRISWWASGDVAVAYSTVTNAKTCGSGGASSCYRYDGDVPVVTVSTSVAYQPLGFLGFLGLDDITLTASHQERVIGVR